MTRRRNAFGVLLVVLLSVLTVGVVAMSHAEDCPDQGGKGADKGIINPPDTDDRKHGCDDETTKPRENNGSGNETDCEDDNNGRIKPGCVAAHPVVTISKTGAMVNDAERIGFPDPGDSIRYTISFGNSGPGSVTNVVVRDVINEGLGVCDQTVDYVTGSASSTVGTVSFGGGVVTVTIASLAAGQNGTLTFDVSIPSGTFHDCNKAWIDSDQTDPLASNIFAF